MTACVCACRGDIFVPHICCVKVKPRNNLISQSVDVSRFAQMDGNSHASDIAWHFNWNIILMGIATAFSNRSWNEYWIVVSLELHPFRVLLGLNIFGHYRFRYHFVWAQMFSSWADNQTCGRLTFSTIQSCINKRIHLHRSHSFHFGYRRETHFSLSSRGPAQRLHIRKNSRRTDKKSSGHNTFYLRRFNGILCCFCSSALFLLLRIRAVSLRSSKIKKREPASCTHAHMFNLFAAIIQNLSCIISNIMVWECDYELKFSKGKQLSAVHGIC